MQKVYVNTELFHKREQSNWIFVSAEGLWPVPQGYLGQLLTWQSKTRLQSLSHVKTAVVSDRPWLTAKLNITKKQNDSADWFQEFLWQLQ